MESNEFLTNGRQMLAEAAGVYGRVLSPEEYWWLGVGLAACTLAELGDRSYAVGRLQQMLDRLGHKGMKEEWLQQFVAELAELDAEGLLWPRYQRSEEGPMGHTGLEVQPGFGADAAYWLALAHVGVALAVNREEPAAVERLAEVILALVETGLLPEHEAAVLAALQPEDA